jgi:hypothetical protein
MILGVKLSMEKAVNIIQEIKLPYALCIAIDLHIATPGLSGLTPH